MEERVGAITGDARWYPEGAPEQAGTRRRRKAAEPPRDADPPSPPLEDYYAPSEPEEDA